MKLTSVEIANFKAIKKTRIDLHPEFTVFVGSNGSGKSSVLQALHWMLQSSRNRDVSTNAAGKASTLSERNAVYMPSPEYQSAGHNTDYGNFKNNPQMDVKLLAVSEEEEEQRADLWLKAARNEGISVHVPAGNPLVATIRDRRREISAYIPGLAGIPLVEEKRSKLVVHRSAAAGDANTVLRNMLDLLKHNQIDSRSGLDLVAELVGRVMGVEFALKVDFDEETHTRVIAQFRTDQMGATSDKAYRPLELAGIGYLQVLQIFCYLVYYAPRLLLVDEPDAHLYPVAQERLVEVLSETARSFGAQVLLTTHSPSIVRALPSDAEVIWMKKGQAQASQDVDVRQLMGWGLLDRKVLLVTEDTDTAMLRTLLGQWPELERVAAIWPVHSSSKIPTPEALQGLREIIGSGMKLLVHQDRDFMMPDEVARFAKPFEAKKHAVWMTRHSDMEAYWLETQVVSAHFSISSDRAEVLIQKALARVNKGGLAIQKLRSKRQESLRAWSQDNSLPAYGDEAVLAEYCRTGEQFGVLGKSLLKALRVEAGIEKLPKVNDFGRVVPQGIQGSMAEDLRAALIAAVR